MIETVFERLICTNMKLKSRFMRYKRFYWNKHGSINTYTPLVPSSMLFRMVWYAHAVTLPVRNLRQIYNCLGLKEPESHHVFSLCFYFIESLFVGIIGVIQTSVAITLDLERETLC